MCHAHISGRSYVRFTVRVQTDDVIGNSHVSMPHSRGGVWNGIVTVLEVGSGILTVLEVGSGRVMV